MSAFTSLIKTRKLLLASSNKGKVTELAHLLASVNIEVIPSSILAIDSPIEDGENFEQNAKIKAIYYGRASKLPALADDSGLCVDALDGAPGIYSARWAEDKGFDYAMELIHNKMQNSTNQSTNAKFICSLCLYDPVTEITENFTANIEGDIVYPPRGQNGFGYDPIFVPKGFDRSFAELDSEIKNSISHRAKALQLFKDALISHE